MTIQPKKADQWYKVDLPNGSPDFDYFEMFDGKGATYYHRQLKEVAA